MARHRPSPGVAADDEEAAADGTGEDDGPAMPAVDVVDLARRVYELMRAELRLEQARGASIVRHR